MDWIKQLPAKKGGVSGYKVRVEAATFVDVLTWKKYVMPWVRKDSKERVQRGEPRRSDDSWNWATLFVARRLFRRSKLYALFAEQVEDHEFLVGLIWVLDRYRCGKRSSPFLWYLSDAPKKYLERIFDGDRPKGVARGLLDTAVVRSFRTKQRGRLFLHADPAGDDPLLTFYRKCRMTQIPKREKIGRVRTNDGRYFGFIRRRAYRFLMSHDHTGDRMSD